MGQTLLVIHGDTEAGELLASPFRARGWDVRIAAPSADDTVEFIAQAKPLAAVFCLDSGECGALEELARTVLGDARTLRPLMVFLGGEAGDIARLKAEIPVGVFVREDELPWVLKHLAFKV